MKVSRNLKILSWFENEKTKDKLEIEYYKKKVASEFQNLKKEDIFPKKEKISIWKKIRLIILGQ